jgi:5-methylcytosine-specific restriction endonuclease McrA
MGERDEIQNKILEFMNNKNEYKLCEDKNKKYLGIIQSIVGDVELDKKRFFTREQRLYIFNKYKEKSGVNKDKYQCPICKGFFSFDELAGDHLKAHTKAGKTELDNLQLLCKSCNSKKGKK